MPANTDETLPDPLSVSRNTAQLEASTLVHAQRWHLKQLLPNATDVETGQVPKVAED